MPCLIQSGVADPVYSCNVGSAFFNKELDLK
jgi:hypothetical protein